MKIDAEPEWFKSLNRHALNSLSLNNKRIVNGSEEIRVNPAYENKSDEDILGELWDILQGDGLTPELLKIEEANAAKFGPRSIAEPWEVRKASLYAYFEGKSDYDPGGFPDVGGGRLRPTTLSVAGENLIKSTSAGLPYMRKKGLVLDDAIKSQPGQVDLFPCVLYTRTQEQRKTRNVWGYPISDLLR